MYTVYCNATDAYDSARFLCENYYDSAPECDITCHSGWYELLLRFVS